MILKRMTWQQDWTSLGYLSSEVESIGEEFLSFDPTFIDIEFAVKSLMRKFHFIAMVVFYFMDTGSVPPSKRLALEFHLFTKSQIPIATIPIAFLMIDDLYSMSSLGRIHKLTQELSQLIRYDLGLIKTEVDFDGTTAIV